MVISLHDGVGEDPGYGALALPVGDDHQVEVGAREVLQHLLHGAPDLRELWAIKRRPDLLLEASVEVEEDGSEHQPLTSSFQHRSYNILQKEAQVRITNLK